MTTNRWVVVDVETDGLYEPIHVVELAAQQMDGWKPVGEPFAMLLDHDVEIPPEVVAIHGYTREFLRRHGSPPRAVHQAFRNYAGDLPLVAHNLSFDWDRCLEPEWRRLGLPAAGRRGFCSMMLARRVVPEATSYRLDALKSLFALPERESHRAANDVQTLVDLYLQVYGPRLTAAGIESILEVQRFAKRTPVAKCLDQIRSASKREESTPSCSGWYYLDDERSTHGPLSASEIQRRRGTAATFVWRAGLVDWVIDRQCAEFHEPPSDQVTLRPAKRYEGSKTMPELVGFCRGIVSDRRVTTAEVKALSEWLQDFGAVDEWPASEIAQQLERFLEDGVVSKREKDELRDLINGLA